jgi:hypothetical protein
MNKSINVSQFDDAFRDMGRNDQFTYEGRHALYEYLEQLGDDIGEEIQLDVIALCCEYAEYSSLDECAVNYFEYAPDYEGTVEDNEDIAREFLQDRTTVIEFNGGVIIQQF